MKPVLKTLTLALITTAALTGPAPAQTGPSSVQRASCEVKALLRNIIHPWERRHNEPSKPNVVPVSVEDVLARPAVAAFRARYATFSGIRDTDNEAYIDLLKQAGPEWTFFDAENAILRQMNNSVFEDKALVDAISNSYRELLLSTIQAAPELSSRLVAKYSDYKSTRFMFSGRSPSINQALREAYRKTAEQYVRIISEVPLADLYGGQRGISGDPASWFLAGGGETADEANYAVRAARSFFEKGGTPLQFFNERVDFFEQRLADTEKLRKKIQGFLPSSSGALAPAEPSSEGVLSPEAIEIFRNVQVSDYGEYVRTIQARFKKRFELKLSQDQAVMLRDYVAFADSFTPGNFARARVSVDLGTANHGFLSVDLRGQGTRNIFATMKALQLTAGQGVRKTLIATRTAYDRETGAMDKLRDDFKTSIVRACGSNGCESVPFSGDDGYFLPSYDFSDKQKTAILREAAKSDSPSAYRITFQPPRYGGPTAESSAPIQADKKRFLLNVAEKFEKSIRENLDGRMPIADLKGITIGIDFLPRQDGQGWVTVIVAGAITPKTKNAVRQALKKSMPDGYRVRDVLFETEVPEAPAPAPKRASELTFPFSPSITIVLAA